MASKSLFSSKAKVSQPADTTNKSGLPAYKLSSKHELAQLSATGCFNNTYYTTAEDQLERVLKLSKEVDPEFVAKLAVYSREQGFMKDMPAVLCAYLSTVDPKLLWDVFPRVIDNGKMLRNFVQIVRSGTLGRKSLGTAPRRLVRSWLGTKSDREVFMMSVGSNPSMGDVIALAHPKPADKTRAAMYGYFLGKDKGRFNDEEFTVADELPDFLKEYEAFKKSGEGEIPRVPMEMLEGLELNEQVWKGIAERASWSQTRQGLNKFARHGVFKDDGLVKKIADRLRDPELIKKANVFPYQLLMTYLATEGTTELPPQIHGALQDAMEIAVDNVPVVEGQIFVFPDVSGSMSSSAVTGTRKGATTKVRSIHVAALVAACFLRRNPHAEIIPFEHGVVPETGPRGVKLNPKDSIMTNAKKLASVGGGATNCPAPLQLLNQRKARMILGVYVSDYESNIGPVAAGSANRYWYGGGSKGSGTLQEFDRIKQRCPEAKLVCIDTAPQGTVQAPDRGDILNVGGFSDTVFDVIDQFIKGGSGSHWVDVIEKIVL